MVEQVTASRAPTRSELDRVIGAIAAAGGSVKRALIRPDKTVELFYTSEDVVEVAPVAPFDNPFDRIDMRAEAKRHRRK